MAKETFRTRPVVFDVGRILTRPVELAGYRLPAGTMVAPGSAWCTLMRGSTPIRSASIPIAWWARA